MTRTQAWRKVAEAFGTPPEQRTGRQVELTGRLETGVSIGGLCWGIHVLEGYRHGIYVTMLRLGNGFGHHRFWWPRTHGYDGERALFAGLMAAMTQRERDELEPGL